MSESNFNSIVILETRFLKSHLANRGLEEFLNGVLFESGCALVA